MNRQQIKKWSLLRHLNFKGYKRTASGNPLNMVKVMFPSQLTIYGNAVQDGTPSPDAPVEVQLCGDRTGNLLDVTPIRGNQIEVTDNKIYLSYYSCVTNISPEYFLEMTGLNPGDTITCSNDTEIIHGVANSVLGRVSFSNLKGGRNFILRAHTTRTSTIPSDFNNDNYGSLVLYGANQADEDGEMLAVMSNLAIYKGSYTADTLPAYEPYGYKVSGRAEGLNLFTSDESKWQIQTYKYFKIPVDGTTTLQMKLKPGKSIPSTLYVGYINTGYPSDTGINWLIANGAYINSGVNMMSNSKGYISMYPPSLFDEMLDAFDIMLVQGSYTAETMPPYEPYQPPQDFAVYLPEQIAKVGDVADEVVVDMEKQTAELVRRIERNEFKGTDAWKNDWFPAIVKNLPETAPAIPSARCVSNHFDHNGDTSVPITQIANVVGTTISVARANLISGVTDAETFKTWLSDKNVYAYYPLATPVTTDITSLQQWDAMPNITGTVSITFDSAIPISNAETEYYSKEYDAT